MATTALDLTAEELRLYRPARESDETHPGGHLRQATKRWERAWEVARKAGRLLYEEFGATRVVAFGSLAHRAWYSAWSDIDLAAWGIPADRFYRAVAAVTGVSSDFEVDLVDAENCRPAVSRCIEQEGIDL